MSRYLVYTPDGVNVHEKGQGETDPILGTITAEDLLRLKRLADREANRERAETKDPEQFAEAVDALVCFARNQTEAATPDPGGLDVDTELARLGEIWKAKYGRAFFTSEEFEKAFATYLRDLESRRKPAEPSGWPEVAATPESVELTEEQVFDLSVAYHDADTLSEGAKEVNAALRSMGLGLHRLDPKPSAEPDPGEDAKPDPESVAGMVECLVIDFDSFRNDMRFFQNELARAKTKVDSIAETVAVVPNLDRLAHNINRKLDAIAERLDGPKVVTADESVLSDVLLSNLFYRLQEKGDFDATRKGVAALLASFGLMIIRKGDPS